ncbi:hypothetical protein [Luteipulveratus mongoliensis]|uniref:Uncharacterized protein n=1 Tax=Luteipulveratus mongoliensis TaxID=571913 RepID=A0A0K1JHQ5_9MICO|nr:hypothetical protein [Luteipulveratus mongoliensis]AKU16239.1 hypothetical protein VV02_10810 [Luteipulveratus mongoliensis]
MPFTPDDTDLATLVREAPAPDMAIDLDRIRSGGQRRQRRRRVSYLGSGICVAVVLLVAAGLALNVDRAKEVRPAAPSVVTTVDGWRAAVRLIPQPSDPEPPLIQVRSIRGILSVRSLSAEQGTPVVWTAERRPSSEDVVFRDGTRTLVASVYPKGSQEPRLIAPDRGNATWASQVLAVPGAVLSIRSTASSVAAAGVGTAWTFRRDSGLVAMPGGRAAREASARGVGVWGSESAAAWGVDWEGQHLSASNEPEVALRGVAAGADERSWRLIVAARVLADQTNPSLSAPPGATPVGPGTVSGPIDSAGTRVVVRTFTVMEKAALVAPVRLEFAQDGRPGAFATLR